MFLRNRIRVGALVAVALVLVCIAVYSIYTAIKTEPESGATPDNPIQIDESNIDTYMPQVLDQIGNDYDVMKSILILFDSYDECADFINTHGGRENLYDLGLGIIPLLDEDENGNKFYNLNDVDVLKPAFESLEDGEYSREPIELGSQWCYLERVEFMQATTEKIREMILTTNDVENE